jgi:hypothetical protein
VISLAVRRWRVAPQIARRIRIELGYRRVETPGERIE